MENTTEVLDITPNNAPSMSLSNNSIRYLSETGRWVKFLAILGFIFLGGIVVFSLMVSRIFASMNIAGMMPFPMVILSVFYIFIGVIYFFPVYYLFRFSTNIKKAFQQNDTTKLENAFESLKSHYKYIGIMTIVILGSYLLMGVFALVGMMLMMMSN